MGVLVFMKIYLTVSIICKSYLYTYIANKNNYELGGPGGFSFVTLWFYKKPVSPEYDKLKKISNYIQLHNIILALVLIIVYCFK